MKRIFTFLFSTVIALSSFAQYSQTVTVTFAGNGKGNHGNGNGNKAADVVIDGRSYTSNGYDNNSNNRNGSWNDDRNAITINNLQVGQHSIAVYRSKNNTGKYGNVNQGNQPAYSSTFTVKQGYDLNIDIKGNGQVSYTEKPIYNNGDRNDRRDRNWRGDRDRNRDRDRDGRNDRDDDWRNNNGGCNNDRRSSSGGYGGYDNRYPAMADATFNELLRDVRGKWLQSGKVSAVKSAFDNTSNYFSVYQVRQLLQLISSEANRFELAKESYKNVVDKNSFTQLYDMFSNQAYKDELDRYVRAYRY